MISESIARQLSASSLIREMFEKGNALRREFGADRVYDFSLGNPDLPAPDEIRRQLIAAAEKNDHAYMPNAGYPALREKIAAAERRASGRPIEAAGVVMTVGAAGALNVILRALLDPGDEVVVPTPYFLEYLTYIRHAGGLAKVADCSKADFNLDLEAIARAIGPRTKAIILNSPNNPCGRIYPAETLAALEALLQARDHCIYVLADEPYAEIAFDGKRTPSPLRHFKNALRVYSWSKSCSLPGERIGYIALGPDCEDYARLCAALVYLNRSLGFVNAPAIWQQVLLAAELPACPVAAYEARLLQLLGVLERAGLPCAKPDGSFYLFPATPTPDDAAFVDFLARYRIIAVPGRAFGAPGYMRLSTCVPQAVIAGSEPAFAEALRDWKAREPQK